MAESKLPDWAFDSLITDDPEFKVAAADTDNIDVSVIDVVGKFTNSEPCTFFMDLDNNICRIKDDNITQLRSCILKPVQTGNAVQISTKIGENYIWFIIMFDNSNDTVKVLNICRKYLHLKGGFIDYLSPRWTGTLKIEVTALEDKATNNGNHGVLEYTIVLDEEAIFLFLDINKRLPDLYLTFYRESVDHSIERALVQHHSDSIVLESLRSKIVIMNASDHTKFTEVVRTISPKPKEIFEDHSKLVKYLTDSREGLKAKEISSEIPRRSEKTVQNIDRKTANVPRQSTNGSSFRQRDDYFRDQADSAGNQAAIIARELDEAMEKLAIVEEISLPWVIAEDEIRLMIENPEAFGDSQKDMLSGGLDPNNPDHLMQSFSEIKEHLTCQRYDMALSRLNGTKTVFQDSEIPQLKQLIETNHLELLKKLYFHSFFGG